MQTESGLLCSLHSGGGFAPPVVPAGAGSALGSFAALVPTGGVPVVPVVSMLISTIG